IQNYQANRYFIDKLKQLEISSVRFKQHVDSIIFLYQVLPLIDTGKFQEAHTLIEEDGYHVYEKLQSLALDKQTLLQVYKAIVLLGMKEFGKARKIMTSIIHSEQKIYSIPLYRSVRIIHLMILFEQKQYDFIEF